MDTRFSMANSLSFMSSDYHINIAYSFALCIYQGFSFLMVLVVLFVFQHLQSVRVSELIALPTQHQELLYHVVKKMEILKHSSVTVLAVSALTLTEYVFLTPK